MGLQAIETVCKTCGSESTLTAERWRCDCGTAYDVPESNPTAYPGPGDGVWRFGSWLSIPPVVSLGEVATPLVRTLWQGSEVSFKVEGTLPTGSYKDRGTAILVSWLLASGVKHVTEDSSGNAGASLAAYCARAGIGCQVFVPSATSPGKLTQILTYGGQVMRVPGPRQAAADAAASAARGGTVYASHAWNPLFVLGCETFAFEVWEQLGRRAPDVVITPVGGGGLFLGSYLGFAALRRNGLTAHLPRHYGIQIAACAPIADAARLGADVPVPVAAMSSVAEGILVSHPVRGADVLAAALQSGGDVISVDDHDLWASLSALGKMGLYVEPTSAVACAGYTALRAAGQVGASEEIVIALTGNGLKASPQVHLALFGGVRDEC